jgi:hypothetical protein
MISVERCALIADFRHFIPRFNRNFLLYGYSEGRVWVRRPKDRVTLSVILVFTLTRPKTFTPGCISILDKYLHWPHVSVKKLDM